MWIFFASSAISPEDIFDSCPLKEWREEREEEEEMGEEEEEKEEEEEEERENAFDVSRANSRT